MNGSPYETPITAPKIPAKVIRDLLKGDAAIIEKGGKLYASLLVNTEHFFREHAGKDYLVYILSAVGEQQLFIFHLKSLEDVPLGLVDFEDVPEMIKDRLALKTRGLEDLIRENYSLRDRLKNEVKNSMGRLRMEHLNDLRLEKERFNQKKREIKAILKEMGVKIKPGSPLSVLLRLL